MGFTTGGTDIVNQIVAKYFHTSIGTAMLIVDGSIVVAGGFTFGWTSMLYALIVLYILSVITDRIMLGISKSKSFYIITDEENNQLFLNVNGNDIPLDTNNEQTLYQAIMKALREVGLR